jgi:hypothetical protein
MSTECPKSSSPNFDASVKKATRFEDLAQICRDDFAQRGLLPDAQPTQPAAPRIVDSGFGFTRTIFIGNSKFELVSGTESGLDSQEAKIRSAFGVSR